MTSTRRIRSTTPILTALLAAVLGGCGRGDADASAMDAAALTAGGSARNGRILIDRYGCGACHTIPGIPGAVKTVGPPLAGIGGRMFVAGLLPNNPENLIRWILDPPAIDSLTAMPNVGLNERKLGTSLPTFIAYGDRREVGASTCGGRGHDGRAERYVATGAGLPAVGRTFSSAPTSSWATARPGVAATRFHVRQRLMGTAKTRRRSGSWTGRTNASTSTTTPSSRQPPWRASSSVHSRCGSPSAWMGGTPYPPTGEVTDVESRRVVAHLTDENGVVMQSEKMVEVQLVDGKIAVVGDQFGLGRVTP